jgi:hypothetical protein
VSLSWLWISVNATANLFERDFWFKQDWMRIEWPVSVLNAMTQTMSPDLYGPVGWGKLRLQGRLRSLAAEDGMIQVDNLFCWKWSNMTQESDTSSVDSVLTQPFFPKEEDDSGWAHIHFDTIPGDLSNYAEFVLFLLCSHDSSHHGALMVEPTHVERNEYRRVGFAEVFLHEWFGMTAEEIIEIV